ncbi:hypothetical protein BH23CHL8_BH23CHL8_24860 [soil metagenome]
MLTLLGAEPREARLGRGLSQTAAARAIGVSAPTWSRIERGAAPGVALAHLLRAMAVVGLDLSTRAYPGGAPLRDVAHQELLRKLQVRIGPGARWQTEVPLPAPGDRRAWDAFLAIQRVRIGVEGETRVRDGQELERRLALKRRDGAVDHVILLLSDTRHNRRFLRAFGDGLRTSFPLDARSALSRLAVPEDPRASAIILL